MSKKYIGAEEESNDFWYGANGCEFMSWKGSHQIFVFPCEEYPNPPSEIWQYHERIETLEQFSDALENSKKFTINYKEI